MSENHLRGFSEFSSLIRIMRDFPKPGIIFKDITPLLADGQGFRATIQALADQAMDHDYVAGIEARGFILAAGLAIHEGKGFLPIRKSGKLPGPVERITYQLEYGSDSLEIHTGQIDPGARVLVIDDVLATGGTTQAAIELLTKIEARVAQVSVLMEIEGLGGRDRISQSHPNVVLTRLLLG